MQNGGDILAKRLKGQFAPVYLTLMSIIQGVALSALASTLVPRTSGLNVTQWILTATTFLLIVVIWNEYLMQVMAFVWLPSVLDSLLPFAFLAAELLAIHWMFTDERSWLLAIAINLLVGISAGWLTFGQTFMLQEENQPVVSLLAAYRRWRMILNGAALGLFTAAWASYSLLQLDRLSTLIAGIALVSVALFFASAVPYWHRILAYALGRSV